MTKEEATNYASQVEQWLLPAPKEFSDLGLQFKGIEVVEGSLGLSYVKATFRNPAAHRSLDLALSTPEIIGAVITNDEIENEYFLLSDYFVHESRGEEELGFRRKESETEEEYFRRYIELLCRYLATELKDVITGRTWIEVPFDWHDYK